MIHGIYRQGVIYPTDPVPADWADGQPVTVEPTRTPSPSDDPDEISRWIEDLRQAGSVHFEPGERERFQAVLDEADAIAKQQMRKEMETGR